MKIKIKKKKAAYGLGLAILTFWLIIITFLYTIAVVSMDTHYYILHAHIILITTS